MYPQTRPKRKGWCRLVSLRLESMIEVEQNVPLRLGAKLWNTGPSGLYSPWVTTQPGCQGFSMQGVIHGGERTLSRISTRFPASAKLSGGEPFDGCSARDIVETVKGMSCGSIPSFARSSGTIGTISAPHRSVDRAHGSGD